MKILVRAQYLFDAYILHENVDLSIIDGIIKYGEVAGEYDHVYEAKHVVPGLTDAHLHLITYDLRLSLYGKSISNIIKLFVAHGVTGIRDTG